MQLKTFIVLDATEEKIQSGATFYYQIKPKIVKGFLRTELDEAFTVQSEFIPQGNGKDKLYFLPGCSVPRFKVRNLFNVTIKPLNATAAFVSKDGLQGSENTLNHYADLCPISVYEARIFMDAVYVEKSKQVFDMLLTNNPTVNTIYVTPRIWNMGSWGTGFGYKPFQTCIPKEIHQHRFKQVCKNNEYQLLSPIHGSDIAKINCPVYYEESLLKLLNVGNIEITEEKYEELRSFGRTADKENHILMMELMSNSDFEKSIFYLLALLKEFGKKIVLLKERDHVNFKSLLSFLNLTDKNLEKMSIQRMTLCLKQHKQFTRTNAMKLSTLCLYDQFNQTQSDGYWALGPVLKPEYENQLND